MKGLIAPVLIFAAVSLAAQENRRPEPMVRKIPVCGPELAVGSVCSWVPQPCPPPPAEPSWIPVSLFATDPGGFVLWVRHARVALDPGTVEINGDSIIPTEQVSIELLLRRGLVLPGTCTPPTFEVGKATYTFACQP